MGSGGQGYATALRRIKAAADAERGEAGQYRHGDSGCDSALVSCDGNTMGCQESGTTPCDRPSAVLTTPHEPERSSCDDDSGRECNQLVHALANVLTGLLMTARIVDWKLPPYSRLKRPVREIERSAERAAELVKELADRFAAQSHCKEIDRPAESSQTGEQGERTLCERSCSWGAAVAVTAQEPKATANLPQAADRYAAPGFLPQTETLTKHCDRCTRTIFPKRDDGEEH